MLYDATVNGEQRKIVGHFGRNGFYYTLDRTNGKFIKADQYVNDLNWTKGINPKTGRPLDYDPKLDVQIYNRSRGRCGRRKKRACPTWHGGVAHQPTAYHPVKKIAYGVGIEAASRRTGGGRVQIQGRRRRRESEREARVFERPLLRLGHRFRHHQPQVIAKAITDIEIARRDRHGRRRGVHRAADGWVIAYHDETLESCGASTSARRSKARR